MASSSNSGALLEGIARVHVPQLAASSSGGGAVEYSLWRPQMMAFLMRHGIEVRDYQTAIIDWQALAAAVLKSAAAEDEEAIALVLGRSSANTTVPSASASSATASSSSASIAQTEEEMQAAKILLEKRAAADKKVTDVISRSKKAFG